MSSEFEDILKTETCDWQYDISLHLRTKNEVLQTTTAKSSYFSKLSQDFVIHDHNSSSDPDFFKFIGGLYGVVRCQLLGFQENKADKNINEEENETDNDDDHVDPQYKTFLENYRAHGKSFVLDYKKDNVFVVYEPDSDDESESTSKPPTDCAAADDNDDLEGNTVSFETNMEGWEKEYVAAEVKLEQGEFSFENSNKDSEENQNKATEKTLEVKVKGRGRKPKDGCKSSTHDSFGQNVASQGEKHVTGNKTDSTPATVKEEEDSDHPPTRKTPMSEKVLDVEKWWHDNRVSSQERAEFREKLMEILKRPFCEEEYQSLLEEISDRKPVQRHRDLRGRIKIYKEKRPGKSFLDHHVDFAKMIDSVREDRPRVLNLLRGFFYWVINVAHKGVFQPWRDPLCLKVLPQQ